MSLRFRELKSPKPKPEPKLPTVAEYLDQILNGSWKVRAKHKTMAPSTWQMAEQVYRLNIFGSPVGQLTLGQVVPSHLESWAATLLT